MAYTFQWSVRNSEIKLLFTPNIYFANIINKIYVTNEK